MLMHMVCYLSIKFYRPGEMTRGSIYVLCLSTFILVSSTVSTIIAEEKKQSLNSILLSGVQPYEYLISVLVHPVMTTFNIHSLLAKGADISKFI